MVFKFQIYYLDQKQKDKLSSATMIGGATLTKLLGTSAWYAPGAVSFLFS